MNNPRAFVLAVRERHKLTQVELGRLMRRTSNYISMVERGDYVPSPSFLAHLELLDRILTVDPEYRTRGIMDEPTDEKTLRHLSGIQGCVIPVTP